MIYTTQTPFQLFEHRIGLSHPNFFVSEFGASVFSTFESMHAALSARNWGVHGDDRQPSSNCSVVYENANECHGSNILSQRNYPCDNHIEAYFDGTNLNMIGQESFRLQLFRCMMAQALWMKGTIEKLRSQNSYGTLIWQLNDNWPSGSWGLLEYGSQKNEYGQVLGGRWKPLMHLIKRSLFQDVFASCGISKDGELGRCFIRNNGHGVFNGTVLVSSWFYTGELHSQVSLQFTLEPHNSIGKSNLWF